MAGRRNDYADHWTLRDDHENADATRYNSRINDK